MQLEDLADQSFELLKAVLLGVEEPEAHETTYNNFRRSCILSQAKSILKITEDIFDLEDRKRTSSSPLLVRGMLENLFILGAAARNEKFMGQKVIYDIEMTAHYARTTAKKASSKRLKEYLEDQASSYEEIAKNIRQEHQINDKFKWSPVDCAQEADLLRQYAIEYAHYSTATHGEHFSLVFREQGWTTAHVVRTVTFVCLKSAEFLLISIKTKERIDLAKQLINLFKELTELERAGKMRELYMNEMKGQQPITRGKRGSRSQQN
jgi:hypothetical protein